MPAYSFGMITVQQAHGLLVAHLGRSRRADHSVFVGYVMGRLAETLGGDIQLWKVVGLCHDFDYFKTATDRSQHGIVVADWLKYDLPPVALTAIKAHDHRTGVRASTKLADALRLADALAIADALADRKAMAALRDSDGEENLRALLEDRPYLPTIITEISRRRGVSLSALASICDTAPAQ